MSLQMPVSVRAGAFGPLMVEQLDPDIGWRDVEWLRGLWRGRWLHTGPSLRHWAPQRESRVTIRSMILADLAIHILEGMFFVGLVGSAVVVIISFVEDAKELSSKD